MEIGKEQLGQHFMIDKMLLEEIVQSAELKKEDVVLEIGFGKGNLTKLLAKKCKVIAVDIDESFNLKLDNVEIVHDNILKVMDKIKFNKIVSNIPFSISEPLFKKLLKTEFELAVLTIGENFYEILKEKTRLGLLFNAFFNIELIKNVSKKSFFPAPRTNSVVVRIIPKENLSDFELVLRELLNQNDKKVKNALMKMHLGKKTKNEMREIFKNFEKETLSKKIFEMSNEEFVKFYDWLKSLDLL